MNKTSKQKANNAPERRRGLTRQKHSSTLQRRAGANSPVPMRKRPPIRSSAIGMTLTNREIQPSNLSLCSS